MFYEPSTVEQLAKQIVKISNISEDKLAYVEKDIWLTYLLRHIYSFDNALDELAFKGGTCLVKCHYGYYRFSEDLDFTWTGGKKQSKKLNRRAFESKYVKPLVEGFGLGFEETSEIKRGARHSHSGKVLNYFFTLPIVEQRVQLPKVKINISFDETIVFPLDKVKIQPFYVPFENKRELIGYFGKAAEDYFAEFSIPVYSKEEIACEKIRALLTRREKINRSRDVVDLFYLSKDVDLAKVVLLPKCRYSKITRALAIPAYGKIFKERVQNIDEYLDNIVEYAKHEPVYLKEVDYAEISKFAKTVLKPVIQSIFQK
ncbi:MAG: nucleotidyl transferase AbiEii/AbiGii toxin family protein [Candidatus Micrarchaeota archaeon]